MQYPIDAIELVLKIETKLDKDTLKEDREKRTEKYHPWERHTNDNDISLRRRLVSYSSKRINDSSITSDSGPWLPILTEFEYKPKIFNDPRNISSDKENMPPLVPVTMPILNITESDFLDRTESLLGKETKWESHVAQQVPLPRSSSPYPMDKPGPPEQLDLEKDDDMDMRDYMERPTNDGNCPNPNVDLVL